MQEATRLGQTRQKVKNILNAVQQAKDDLIDYIQDDLNIIDLSM